MNTLLIWLTLQAGSATALPNPPAIPEGWVQVPYEAYHGPEGAYHDRLSGAWLEYCICIPQMLGVPDWAVHPRDASSSGDVGDVKYSVFTGGPVPPDELAVSYHLSDGRFAGYFRAKLVSEAQRKRAKELLLGGTRIWERFDPGYKALGRDAKTADWKALSLGANVPTVFAVIGVPSGSKPLPSGGFAVEQLIRTGGLQGSRWVWLEFDQAQRLVRK